MKNILSIDVEDYFHPSEVQALAPPSRWDQYPSRLDYSVNHLLDVLAAAGVRTTCFLLGWAAERHPRLMRRIAEAGHEIGCHSYAHQLVYSMTPEAFRLDTERAIAVIEDACGVRPRCYRAPSYSVTRQSLFALEILASLGFAIDSSIYPIEHDRYGIPGHPRHAHSLHTPSGPILEVPPASTAVGPQILPVGGGGYLRLLPYRYTAAGLRRINREENQPACLYLHPWEIDPGQPRLTLGWVGRLRTYSGLQGMTGKLERLLREFEFCPLGDCYPGAPRLNHAERTYSSGI